MLDYVLETQGDGESLPLDPRLLLGNHKSLIVTLLSEGVLHFSTFLPHGGR